MCKKKKMLCKCLLGCSLAVVCLWNECTTRHVSMPLCVQLGFIPLTTSYTTRSVSEFSIALAYEFLTPMMTKTQINSIRQARCYTSETLPVGYEATWIVEQNSGAHGRYRDCGVESSGFALVMIYVSLSPD